MKTKTSRPLRSLVDAWSWFGPLVCLAVLVASTRPAQAQYALIPPSDYLNAYFFDGSSTIYGTDPTPFTTGGTGTPLTSYTWLTTSTTPGPEPLGTFSYGPVNSGNATAAISYQQASLFSGSNSLSQGAVSPVGTSVSLLNSGSGVAEVRLDWTAQYTYSGANGASVPDFFLVDMQGTLGTYALLAGQEQFQVNSGPVVTASIPIGGDWSSSAGYPGGVNPSADFWGYDATTPFQADPSGIGGPMTINSGDTLTVNGYIDVIVDPGSVNIEILVPEPNALLLSLLGGLVMFWGFRRRQRAGAVS